MKKLAEILRERREEQSNLKAMEAKIEATVVLFGDITRELVCVYTIDINATELVFEIKYAETHKEAFLDQNEYPHSIRVVYSVYDGEEEYLEEIEKALVRVAKNAMLHVPF